MQEGPESSSSSQRSSSSPSCLLQLAGGTVSSPTHSPLSGDPIETRVTPAPLQPGLINGLSARAEARSEVYETFTSLLFQGPALQTGSWPPCHHAFYTLQGSWVGGGGGAVFQLGTSEDVLGTARFRLNVYPRQQHPEGTTDRCL